MENAKINAIYKNFLSTEEYQHRFKDIKIDLVWLEDKISLKEMLRLEAMVSAYGIQNASAMFESGFQYAWNLFHDLMDEQM